MPLKSLTASIKQVGEGNLDQNVPVLSKDELGLLAGSFNQMAAQLRQYQANTSVELLRLNETIRATLASFPDPVFVLNAEGAVEFRNPAADHLAMKLLFAGVTRLPAKVDDKVEEVRASGQDYLPTSFQDAVKFHIDGQDRYFLPRDRPCFASEKGDDLRSRRHPGQRHPHASARRCEEQHDRHGEPRVENSHDECPDGDLSALRKNGGSSQ